MEVIMTVVLMGIAICFPLYWQNEQIKDLNYKLHNQFAEIEHLKDRLNAVEKLAKNNELSIAGLEYGGKPFQCPDKAGDNVTLEEMKG